MVMMLMLMHMLQQQIRRAQHEYKPLSAALDDIGDDVFQPKPQAYSILPAHSLQRHKLQLGQLLELTP